MEKFIEKFTQSFGFKNPYILLGKPIYNGQVIADTPVGIPYKMLNRHGLIAGATGTGKTKTLQVFAEQLSEAGIPVLLMDLKGDVSGLAKAGQANAFIEERHLKMGIPFHAKEYPIEFLSISNEPGTRLRATISEFGPVLFSKMLGLNDTQSGVMSILFKYADDHNLALIDLADIKELIKHVSSGAAPDFKNEYGQISTASLSTILRKIIELEQQGADLFFGELSFEIEDLLRKTEDGKGIISLLRLTDIQDKPKLFSTFMLCLLAEVYNTLPEKGDADKPELILVFDEAHLIFNEASKALLDQLESIIKLIRSKGVGVYFCTQSPDDVPAPILAQLGTKIQHALRAFTAKDRKAIKSAAENYPISEFYDPAELLTNLGIGEALFSGLNEKGIPIELSHLMVRAPQSRMNILSDDELNSYLSGSKIRSKYNEKYDRESAYEILSQKISSFSEENKHPAKEKGQETQPISEENKYPAKEKRKEEKTVLEEIGGNPFLRQVGNTLIRELTRGLLGVLGIGGKSHRRRKY